MNANKNDAMLICSLEAIAIPDEKIALYFDLQNLSDHPININYFEPFVDFTLNVYANNRQVEIVQPSYDIGLQRATLTIEPGKATRIKTPIQLAFDPDVEPNGGNIPTLWTLRHVSAPILLRVSVHLEGVMVTPCEVYFNSDTTR